MGLHELGGVVCGGEAGQKAHIADLCTDIVWNLKMWWWSGSGAGGKEGIIL